jgi:hypothetical protein
MYIIESTLMNSIAGLLVKYRIGCSLRVMYSQATSESEPTKTSEPIEISCS